MRPRNDNLAAELIGFIAGLALTGFVVGAAWILLAALILEVANAADFGCGRDTDRNGSVDRLCPGNDKDFDGYTVATGDCDDEEWQIFPGTLTAKGCSAGQFRKCASSGGTYGSCKALADISASDIGSGVLNIYWLASDGTTGGSGGTYANPWALECLGRSAATCYHNPVAGDAFVVKAGTYQTSWTFSGGGKRTLYIASDGTESNPIYIIGDPTERPVIVGQGTGISDQIPIVDVYDTNWVTISGIELTGGYAGPIWIHSVSSGAHIYNMIIRDADGDGGTVNHAGIAANVTSDFNIHHNLIYDNYNRANPTNVNSSQIVLFSGVDVSINYNVMYTTRTGGAGYVFKYKHGQDVGSFDFIGNYIKNGYSGGVQWCNPNANLKNNLVIDASSSGGSCFSNENGGGTPFYDNSIVENNTCVNSNFAYFQPVESTGEIGDNALTLRYNIHGDESRASYSCEGAAGCVVNIYNYGNNDPWYTDIVTGGKFSFTRNGYYNSQTDLVFTVFGNNQVAERSLGSVYNSWSGWTGAGYDSLSVNADPAFDASYISENEDMAGWGYMQPAEPEPEPEPSTTVYQLSTKTKARARRIR